MMTRLLIIIVTALMVAGAVSQSHAQAPVLTQPYPITSTQNSSGTIASTNVFQSIWTNVNAVRGRAGCTVQNKSSSNNMFVFFGAIANATTTNSVTLQPGQAAYCQNYGIVLQDQVSITGTSGDAFYAAQQ